MSARNKPYRGIFGTPFWTEGNSLYWELLLWDLGFAKTPEQKIGMLSGACIAARASSSRSTSISKR
jgi:uncharacterized protein (DUF885 family)